MTEEIEPPDSEDFSAIGSSDKAEPPDSRSVKEQLAYFNDEPRLISQAHRRLRNAAFWVFGGLSLAFFVTLLCVLYRIFTFDAPFLYFLARHHVDWHGWLFATLAMVIFAAVPLSLTMGLMRMISDRKDEDKGESSLKLPNTEALKALAEILKR